MTQTQLDALGIAREDNAIPLKIKSKACHVKASQWSDLFRIFLPAILCGRLRYINRQQVRSPKSDGSEAEKEEDEEEEEEAKTQRK